MIEPDVMMSSEETAALGQLKEIISANVPSGMIEAHAFRLVGEPQETIDAETGELKESIGHVSGREGVRLSDMSERTTRSRNIMSSAREQSRRGLFLARRR